MNRAFARAWPRGLINALRALRRFGYRCLGPFDYVCRVVNDKADFPPLHLRRFIGPLRSFESAGAEFMSYLQLLVRLDREEKLLDIGCGCGSMALQLRNYFQGAGCYVGADIDRASIDWCRKNISPRDARFRFHHIDVKSLAYNARGGLPAERFSFPFDDESFDVILLKSVFTHMRPAEVDNYLREVARLLAPGGRCLMTFFLLNKEQVRLAEGRGNELDFRFGEGVWRYVYEHSPETAVAFAEGYVLDLLGKHGLALGKPIAYGRWSGRRNYLSFQDILLVVKAGQSNSAADELQNPIGKH